MYIVYFLLYYLAIKNIVMRPRYQAVMRNGMASFSCSCPGASEFIWLLDDGPILSGLVAYIGIKRETISILSVDSKTVGNYSCEAYDFDFTQSLGIAYGYLTFITGEWS